MKRGVKPMLTIYEAIFMSIHTFMAVQGLIRGCGAAGSVFDAS